MMASSCVPTWPFPSVSMESTTSSMSISPSPSWSRRRRKVAREPMMAVLARCETVRAEKPDECKREATRRGRRCKMTRASSDKSSSAIQ